ncbi:MAG: hypothetical protein WCV63_01140 [Negativicutes bacterium]|jgi:hypothetical protein
MENVKFVANKAIIKVKYRTFETADELLSSKLFHRLLASCINELAHCQSPLLEIFAGEHKSIERQRHFVRFCKNLYKLNYHDAAKIQENCETYIANQRTLNDFVMYVYDYWRSYNRYIICDSENDTLDQRPYRTFMSTVEQLNHLIRGTYRALLENINCRPPRVYRQIVAGAEVSVIAIPNIVRLPGKYAKLKSVLVIRQILLSPPLIVNQPNNKRKGKFEKVLVNPIQLNEINPGEWLCFPAKVGKQIILIYFHENFFELGMSLCNLFELASDEDLTTQPSAFFMYGVPGESLYQFSDHPTVFFDDAENKILVGACPNKDEFGYFGYLKKMVLTLHNIHAMKQGSLPFHGALIKISFDGNKKTVLIMGDTGTGKSETIEAIREIGGQSINSMQIIADDMGSLEISGNAVVGFGTEIGAFLRIDDLRPGYIYGKMDRAIIMNPTQTNARVIYPVATIEDIIAAHSIDFVLYANNYELTNTSTPAIERFEDVGTALAAFRSGQAMSKGTTNLSGMTHAYFANVFGPDQYRELHDPLSDKYFTFFFDCGIYVGQLRTQLGIPGLEFDGPKKSAKALLDLIATHNQD